MKGERICVVCGTHYKYCPSCGQDNPADTWRFIYCSENCRQIFKTVEQVKAGRMSNAQAVNELSKLKLPTKIQEHIHKDITRIFGKEVSHDSNP